MTSFMMSTTSSIAMQSLGKIALRAPAVGAETWCLYVFSNLMPFSATFSEGIALSGALHGSHLCRQVAPQFSRNCRQKLRRVQKSAEKFVRTTSYR